MLEEIVKSYETEHEVDVFKIENGKYLIYQFNSTSQSYKKFRNNNLLALDFSTKGDAMGKILAVM